jgi:Holliday junction resolvase-like predicted endonuclease
MRARELGLDVHVACDIGALYSDSLVEDLSAVAPIIHIEDEGQETRSLLLTLAMEGIQVAGPTRQTSAADELTRALDPSATADQKGKRFEALIAFLFSQTDGFRVSSVNYETSTEEIDIVIRQLSTQGRIWSREGPLILIEARNRASGISQEMFSAFRTKLQVKRGRAKLGFMVSSTTVSGAAERQEEKTALGDIAIVFIDGEDLVAWIEAEDHDAWLERQVEKRILE